MFNKKSDLFQEQKQASELISFADVWNICKDYDFQKFAQKDSVLNIMKQVNSNPQYTFLKYTDFVQFMIQLSIFMFSAPPKDLRGQPLGNQIKEMFKMMAIFSKRRGENTIIFENPECYVANLDAATIKNWNNRLLNDPNAPIPDNLKKVPEKQFLLKNEFNQNNIIGLSQGYIYAYKIIQDVMKEKFGINLGENTMQINNIFQVRPKPIPQMFQSGKGNSQSPEPFALKTENNENSENPIIKKISQTAQISKKKNSQSAIDLRAGGMSSKNADSRNQNQYQSLWVEKYSQYGLPGIQKNKKTIVNQVIQDRIKKEEEQQKKSASQDKRIKERKAELEQKKKELEAFKLKKKQEDEEKKQNKNKNQQQEKDKFQQVRLKQIEKKNQMSKKKEELEMQKQKDKQFELEKLKEQELMKQEQRKDFQKKIDVREEKRVESIEKRKIKEEEEKKKKDEKLQKQQQIHQAKNKKFQKEREKKKAEAQQQILDQQELSQSILQQSQLQQSQLQQSLLQQQQQPQQPQQFQQQQQQQQFQQNPQFQQNQQFQQPQQNQKPLQQVNQPHQNSS